MIQESIITELPLTVKNFYGYTGQDAGFLMLSFTPLTLSMSLLPGYLAQKRNFRNANLMLTFLLCLFVTLILKINLHYDTPQNKIYYIIVTCLALTFTLAAEVSMTAMLGKIAPYYIVHSFWNPGLLSGMCDSFGRTMGNSSVSLFNTFNGIKSLTFYMYIVWSGIVFVLIIILIVKIKTLKIIWKVWVSKKRIMKEFAALEKVNLVIPEEGEVREVKHSNL